MAIYCRRSTDEHHQPHSPQAQETRLRAFADAQYGDGRIVRAYHCDDATASGIHRSLHNVVHDARAGVFDTLLVYRLHRLTGSMSDLVWLLGQLADAGVVVRSATEPFDSSTPLGRVFTAVLGVTAEMERDMRRRAADARPPRCGKAARRRQTQVRNVAGPSGAADV